MYKILNTVTNRYLEFNTYKELILFISKWNFKEYCNTYNNEMLSLVGINDTDKLVYYAMESDGYTHRYERKRVLRILYNNNNIYDKILIDDVLKLGVNSNTFKYSNYPIKYINRFGVSTKEYKYKPFLKKLVIKRKRVKYHKYMKVTHNKYR